MAVVSRSKSKNSIFNRIRRQRIPLLIRIALLTASFAALRSFNASDDVFRYDLIELVANNSDSMLESSLGDTIPAGIKNEAPAPVQLRSETDLREDAASETTVSVKLVDESEEKKERKALVVKKTTHKKIAVKNIRDEAAGKEIAKVDLTLFQNDRKTKLKRPKLSYLIKDEEEGIQHDVRFMMDFAILGHAKCATTFVSSWLQKHPQVKTFDREVCDLYDMKPAGLVKKLYEELPAGDYQRGFKCPSHFSRRPMRYFRRFFGKTKLIVGIRHPIRWFESFYNFVSRHGQALPDPNDCIGVCTPEMRGVCTDRASFHVSLAIFGKTNMSNPTERRLLRMHNKYQFISPIDNPLFIYHSDQLYDKNTTRFERVRSDFQNFMGLSQPMPNVTKYVSKRGIIKKKTIDICDAKYVKVRQELLKVGERASAWIRRYFLDSPQVFYSDRSYMDSLLRNFSKDPCWER